MAQVEVTVTQRTGSRPETFVLDDGGSIIVSCGSFEYGQIRLEGKDLKFIRHSKKKLREQLKCAS